MLSRFTSFTSDSFKDKARLRAINKSHAVIEFTPDGIIKDANENFLSLLRYEKSEIVGKHHKMFVEEDYAKSEDYQTFWRNLLSGEHITAEFMRLDKNGKEIWIQASYNPILDANDIVTGVIKFATDVTGHKIRKADNEGQIAAINKAQAVIHFDLDGRITDANENFLNAMEYTLDEIKGRHHGLFVDEEYRQSDDYKHFWEKLNRGEFHAGEFKRFGKNGKEVWIQASYNPIFDEKGHVFKIVKFATDVTERKMRMADINGQMDAVNKAQAVIHFNLDGTIIDANENFLKTLGYTLPEVKGQHHSMFVDADYAKSPEYKEFWEKLNAGTYHSAEYKRFGKNGKEVWIQATYNPILDLNDNPFKVVKYATDITQAVKNRQQKEAVQQEIARELAGIATAMHNTTERATTAAGASDETNANVQTIAAAVEELDATINSLAESMTLSNKTSDKAYECTNKGGEATKRLLETADSMTGISEMIQGIASQINLLALNATIESARAGEAGRGFAVVANEVKNLALQAATATEQIAKEIEDVQNVSKEVDESFTSIKSSLEEVRSFVVSSTSAVEEQSAATREMTGSMQSAAKSVSDINNNITEIASAAEQANAATKKVEEMSKAIV